MLFKVKNNVECWVPSVEKCIINIVMSADAATFMALGERMLQRIFDNSERKALADGQIIAYEKSESIVCLLTRQRDTYDGT